jgi:serine/threonine protein kinase
MTGGWKLHVSAVPIDAENALEAAAEIARVYRAPFKVCADLATLVALNSGELGESQVGKFCTIYPADDAVAVDVAAALVSNTASVRGPVVPTDFAVGGVVYARYGAFEPIVRFDRFDNRSVWIHLPDGTEIEDERFVPHREIEGVLNPFRHLRTIDPPPDGAGRGRIGPGYRCIEVLRGRTTGSVFLALSLQESSGQSRWRVLKQARAHTYSDELGRDRRDRLRHEERVFRALEGGPGIPRCDGYFELDGDGYLPVELVRGEPLIAWASRVLGARTFGTLESHERTRMVDCGVALVRAVRAVHERGFLHRDISANNVIVEADGSVRLIDFELAYEIGSDAPPFFTGTPGFMSLNQLERGTPRVADDVHALAACLVTLLTGTDPRLLVGRDPSSTARRLKAWTEVADPALWEAVSACLDPAEIRSVPSALERSLTRLTSLSLAPRIQPVRPVSDVALRALTGLAASEVRSKNGLPVSIESGGDADLSEIEEIAADAHRGVAGVLYLLALGARLGVRDVRTDHLAWDCIRWLLARDPSPAAHLPGLFFGRAGWAVALDDAVESELIPRPSRWDDMMLSLFAGPLDWYDLTHGVAGQGLAALRLARGTRRDRLLAHAATCAGLLADTQEPDGSWRVPPGVPGLSGRVLPGLAHGVAGIVYFLATATGVLRDAALERAWERGIHWLLAEATAGPRGSLEWSYSDTQTQIWHWWCHGGPGIGLAFLRAYEVSGDETHARAAARALAGVQTRMRHANFTQCHGLAGLGQIFLEGWRVLGDDTLLAEAKSIAELLLDSAHESSSGDLLWFAESFQRPTGDLMQGGGGPVHLLLCLTNLDHRVAPPLLVALEDLDRSAPRR